MTPVTLRGVTLASPDELSVRLFYACAASEVDSRVLISPVALPRSSPSVGFLLSSEETQRSCSVMYQSKFLTIVLPYFLCMSVLSASTSYVCQVHAWYHPRPEAAIRSHQISWDWSYRWLGTAVWELEMKSGSSGRTATTFNH